MSQHESGESRDAPVEVETAEPSTEDVVEEPAEDVAAEAADRPRDEPAPTSDESPQHQDESTQTREESPQIRDETKDVLVRARDELARTRVEVTRESYADAILASAPGIGTRIGAVNVSTLSPFGWAMMACGIAGTLLIAISYLAGWLTASLESFGVAETESLSLDSATSTPLAWMYRIATLGLIGCATGLVFAPKPARPLLRIAGFAAAGLSLFSAVIATLIIATVVARGAEYLGDVKAVGYGWGFYCGYAGIVAVTGFVASFGRLTDR